MDKHRIARELVCLAERLTAGRKRMALRPENKRMRNWLKRKGIDASVKYLWKGSMRGTWRLYNPKEKWTQELADKLSRLGFRGFDGKPLHQFSGNGGMFSVFVRGHDELLGEDSGESADDLSVEQYKGRWLELLDDVATAITVHARRQGKKRVLSRVTAPVNVLRELIAELD